MTATTRKLIERPDLDSELSEQASRRSIERLTVALLAIAAVMTTIALIWIAFGSASLLSLAFITVFSLLLIIGS